MKQMLKKIIALLIVLLIINLWSFNTAKAANEENVNVEESETTEQNENEEKESETTEVDENVDENKEEENETEEENKQEKVQETDSEANLKAGTDAENGTNDFKFTDFSNAKYEWKKQGVNTVYLDIKNITINKESTYYAIIAKNSTKINLKDYLTKYDNIDLTKSDIIYTKKTDEGILEVCNIEKYLELNQDIYLWLIEESKDNVDFVVSGKKMEEYTYPKYAEAFYLTHLTSEGTQIPIAIPWDQKTVRKATIKVGRITNNDILNKIKNNKAEGWTELAKYVKTANSVYNNKVTFKDGEYRTNENMINISKLTNKAYYYLDIVFDDENGKYRPYEALTLAKSDVYTNSKKWFMFFLGDDEFNWDNLSIESKPTPTVTTNTTPVRTLPYTGTKSIIAVLIITTMIGLVIFKYKNDKYRGI